MKTRSREEPRTHVHVCCSEGEAKFWLEPFVELARNHGLTPVQVTELKSVVEEKRNELINAWRAHFGG